MPPLWRECTLEKLAVNAVMAGCEPAYFPVIVAAVAGAARSRLQPLRRAGDHASGGAAARRATGPTRATIGVHAGTGLLRPRLPRQRHHRARDPAHPDERRRRLAGPRRHGHPGQPREVLLRIAENEEAVAVGAAARGAVRRATWSPCSAASRPHNVNDHVSTTARRHPQQRRRTRPSRSARTSAGTSRRPAPGRARARARRAPSPTTGSRAPTCSASSTSTRGCRSAGSSSAACGACTTGRAG